MQLEVTCVKSNKTYKVVVPDLGFIKWQNGEHIQDAMPEVSPDDRELLMSHICGRCFDKIFGG